MKEVSENHWENIQAKTFTKWVNDKLSKGGFTTIKDIYTDFEDGVALGNLISVILKTTLVFNRKPFTRIQKVENLEILLKIIKREGVTLINIGPEDIVDGNRKLILGLIWTIISRLSISEIGGGDISVREELLRWCRQSTEGYDNVNIVDLSRSWQDGLGFNAIIHNFRPDLIGNYDNLKSCERYKNLEQAFSVAEEQLGISRLLDIEDVADVIRPDEKSMITYLSQYYQKFFRMETERNSRSLAFDILSKLDWSVQHKNLNELKARAFLKEKEILQLRKREVENILNNLLEKMKEVEEINSHLSASYVESHTLYYSINALHKMYNFKPYKAPEEISLQNIEYDYSVDYKGTKELIKKFNNEEERVLGTEIKEITSLITKENMNAIVEVFKRSLLKVYASKPQEEDAKGVRDILKNYIEFLSELSKEEVHREEVVNKAKLMYSKMAKEKGTDLSLTDIRLIFTKVGIVVDDNSLKKLDTNNGIISYESFEDAIKVLTIRNYDLINVKKALKVFGGNSEYLDLQVLNEVGDNLQILTGKENKIEINELVKEFIKDN